MFNAELQQHERETPDDIKRQVALDFVRYEP